ncbi:MAG TPA: hypothetical protein VFC63_25215 [Blastocatellia bacterium]|nr:hypothetical protein [Blastocatellia bacterium]
MRLFAAALLARKSEGGFELIEPMPVVVTADSEKEAGKEAKRQARKTYPKDQGWHIVGRIVEIDHTKLLETIITSDDETTRLFPNRSSGRTQ